MAQLLLLQRFGTRLCLTLWPLEVGESAAGGQQEAASRNQYPTLFVGNCVGAHKPDQLLHHDDIVSQNTHFTD
eukprot:3850763-Amphidinium_carterae.1